MEGFGRMFVIVTLLSALAAGCAVQRASLSSTGPPPPLSAGKVADLLPDQAYEILRADPKAILLDVRTQAEFIFVGHPVGAYNLPLQFWDAKTYQWSDNADVDAKVLARFSRDDIVITMCRSGHRSRRAAERLVGLGYTRVYNMVESFEGDADPATGLRTVNGWKNRGLPYAYESDNTHVYWP